MKQCTKLNEGPLDGLCLTAESQTLAELRSVSLEYVDRELDDNVSVRYELADCESSSDETIHRLVRANQLSPDSPVGIDVWAKCQLAMTANDRDRWNSWRYSLFSASEQCRDIVRDCGVEEIREAIDDFQELVLGIPVMRLKQESCAG